MRISKRLCVGEDWLTSGAGREIRTSSSSPLIGLACVGMGIFIPAQISGGLGLFPGVHQVMSSASLGYLEGTIPLMLLSASRSFLVLLLLCGIPLGLFIRRRGWDTSMRSLTRDDTWPEHEAPRNQSAQQLSDALIAGRQTRPIHEDWNLDTLQGAAKGGRGRRDLTSEIGEV